MKNTPTSSSADREQVIVGTAGHVDHGKSSLVKALSGTDPDTLAEEKERGLTIELGFVFMETPPESPQMVFIDVPGHEKFIKTMVAGAANIDVAILVVAADDGVSAQTEEHLDILQLLGVSRGLIALTKIDMADERRVAEVADEIRLLLVDGTFLAEAPIVPVSSVTGEGLDVLKQQLLLLRKGVNKRSNSDIFRMPIDRVFAMKGFGAVIAGTIISGQVRVGDTIEIFPDRLLAKVRGIQVNHQSAECSFTGRRTAINIAGIEKEKLSRGQCAALQGTLTPTRRLDGRLMVLRRYGKALKNRTRLRLHVGRDEVIGRLVVHDRDVLEAGDSALVQFVLEAPTVALPGDPFVIRAFSPVTTIGGGVVLDADPHRHKRFDPATMEGLERLDGGIVDVVEQYFVKARFVPVSTAEVAVKTGKREADINAAIAELLGTGKLVPAGGGDSRAKQARRVPAYIHRTAFAQAQERLIGMVNEYFAENRYRLWLPAVSLRTQFEKFSSADVFDAALDDLCNRLVLECSEGRLATAGRDVDLNPAEREIAEKITDIFAKAGFQPPSEEEVQAGLGIPAGQFKNIMHLLCDRRTIVRVNQETTFAAGCIDTLLALIKEHEERHLPLKVADLRDKLGTSRKYAKALLVHYAPHLHTRQTGDDD